VSTEEIPPRGPGWDAALPPVRRVGPDEVAALLAGGRRLVVLDDDPTGTQTVRDVPVLTRWQPEDVGWALDRGGPGFFILTNTRSLDPAEAAARNRDVAIACLAAAAERGIPLAFASRGDSTLRGHFPLETDALREVLRGKGEGVDAILLSPAYLDAGRVTLDGVHWLHGPEGLTPVGASEFARDATFGFRSSHLADWVAEKSGGAVPSSAVRVVRLPELRAGDDHLRRELGAARDGAVVVVDAVADDDLRAAALELLAAEADGARVLLRVGPSFVRARLGQGAHPPLTDAELAGLVGGRDAHGLVAVGSHVGLTSRQLARLHTRLDSASVVLDVQRIVDGDSPGAVADAVVTAVDALADRLVVVSTSRDLVTGRGPDESLDISRRVSAALTATVRDVVAVRRPAFVVAKGGITSSDIATGALGIDRAEVRGSLLPGIVSLWEAASGPSAGLPYVVFAGNVGDDESLAEVVGRLEAGRERA
jgi:uncharacterized protein YgbK (DUF1537 family)